jgi:hypothetical protein
MEEMSAAARAAGREVTGRCVLLFGDRAVIEVPGEGEPVRWPAAGIASATGVAAESLPGRELVFTLSESPEHGRELRGFRLA